MIHDGAGTTRLRSIGALLDKLEASTTAIAMGPFCFTPRYSKMIECFFSRAGMPRQFSQAAHYGVRSRKRRSSMQTTTSQECCVSSLSLQPEPALRRGAKIFDVARDIRASSALSGIGDA